MKKSIIIAAVMASVFMAPSCSRTPQRAAADDDFNYRVDRFADIEVLRYKVPDFDSLSLNQKILVYYLQEAALWGRDILWDQNYRGNLAMRQLLEAVYGNYSGDKESADYKAFETYLKQVWFGNGIHHHYSTDKFVPAFSREFLEAQIAALPEGAAPAGTDELVEVIFNPALAAKRVNQAEGADLIATSANNFYEEGLTQAEVEKYYASIKKPNDATPISYGLNTRLRKENGKIVEDQYKVGGLYTEAIEHIVANLDSASAYAENPAQKQIIESLIDFYRPGDLATFDKYSIEWAEDTISQVDFI
ncbi:MAG: dipeptidyl peptidase 3, partial [Muribaculaceae bacterium]|nr:dipeptidyl peptidase 3 [Muribaculaceae bacterium]